MGSTQIVVGNFGEDVRAEAIVKVLEASVGMVWRCKLKITAPPVHERLCLTSADVESHASRLRTINFPCHAYVHFVSPQVAKEACTLANAGRLLLKGILLKAQMPNEGWRIRRPRVCALRLLDVFIECGTLCSWDEFVVSWKSPVNGVTMEVDKVEKKCRFLFFQDTLFCVRERNYDGNWSECEFKLEFSFRDIRFIHEAKCRLESDEGSSILLQLLRPPWLFYRMADGEVYHKTSFPLPDDQDPWIRTIDFTLDKSIGRHLSYLINFSPRQITFFRKVMDCFRKEGLHVKQTLPSIKLPYEVKCRSQRAEFFYSVPQEPGIRFNHLILVNSLVHQGIINVSSLTNAFFSLMRPRITQPEVVTFALKHMLKYNTPLFDAIKRLEQIIHWASMKTELVKELKVLEGHSLIYRLIITPTKAYCSPPEYDMSNRILRHFRDYSDRFLRVSFLDDNLQTLKSGVLSIPLSPFAGDRTNIRTAIFRRVLSVLREGFFLCGRRYFFLAFSASQLRDHSAWFFANHPNLHAEDIRAWMGEIPTRVVAKCAARMGHCFSSTYATVKIKPGEVEHIRDIECFGYNFSDGIGKITPSLAKEVADILKLKGSPPSAYQIRYAGYKGVVATWAQENPNSPYKLPLRQSMGKFISTHPDLEVVGWTRFFPCFLNRQIITLLSTLRVPDCAFMDLQTMMVSRLNSILQDPKLALEVLTTTCNGELHQTTILMLRAGFKASSEPHLKEMLQAIRAMQMDDIVTKARIFVPNGRWLMCCLDELSLLKYGQCFIRVTCPDRKGDSESALKVITGKLVMAKNPCLHPGDIRSWRLLM
ncbi:hypothetical protein O6H91_08G022500 [Diphasiastrum complanatum]|uniref:Uncharacterized protein n=1 Tax=Diphasiastrum complanatum TaxID=34168 RepID=A0ACC2CVN4_DIPCM|nr:hypothetical protein O6H91_08G022500 [Diphasiastrum complanatum]